MKNNKEVKISYWAHHFTTIVSVTLVLLLLGIIASVWIGANAETRRLKERLELSVIMADSIPDGSAQRLADKIGKAPYAHNVHLITREEALSAWTEETGENLQELFGVNPMTEEIAFSVNADYASAARIARIKSVLEKEPGVESVSSPDTEMVESMNANLSHLTLILSVIAAVMLFISFVLINNTVHLTIYSRRFTIHTMQLVGATNGFIRRPIIANNALAGLLAGLLASALLTAAIAGSGSTGMPDLTESLGWPALAVVAAGMTLTGVLLCTCAAWISANSYLRKDYGQLFS